MAKEKKQTVRAYLRLDPDAVAVLDQLAPSENKRGACVSDLLRKVVQQDTAPPDATELAYASIGRHVVALAVELARFLPDGPPESVTVRECQHKQGTVAPPSLRQVYWPSLFVEARTGTAAVGSAYAGLPAAP